MTARLPFHEIRNELVVMTKMLKGHRPPIANEISLDAYPAIWDVVNRCWSSEPKHRPTADRVLLSMLQSPEIFNSLSSRVTELSSRESNSINLNIWPPPTSERRQNNAEGAPSPYLISPQNNPRRNLGDDSNTTPGSTEENHPRWDGSSSSMSVKSDKTPDAFSFDSRSSDSVSHSGPIRSTIRSLELARNRRKKTPRSVSYDKQQKIGSLDLHDNTSGIFYLL
jgi:hypothetical protein